MRIKEYKTELGIIKIEEKESQTDKEVFVGAVKLSFIPNLPKRDNLNLKVFSCSMPEHTRNGTYEYLMSWYDEFNHNQNNFLIGDE